MFFQCSKLFIFSLFPKSKHTTSISFSALTTLSHISVISCHKSVLSITRKMVICIFNHIRKPTPETQNQFRSSSLKFCSLEPYVYTYIHIYKEFYYKEQIYVSNQKDGQVPRSAVSNLETQESKWYSSSPKRLASSRPRKGQCFNINLKTGIKNNNPSEGSQKSFPLIQGKDRPFGSIQAFNQLDEVHPHQGGQPAFLILSI